jgi:predicted DNA-binding transcriptional regulator AlpA
MLDHDDHEALWNAKDVAAYLKASRSWVYLHAEDGTLPSVRICGLRRFIPAEIRALPRGESGHLGSVVSLPSKGNR